MTIATAVARRPIASETRPAISVRVRRSRPLASVPNRKRWRSIGTSIESRRPSSRALEDARRAEQVGALEEGEQALVDRARRRRASRRRASPSIRDLLGAGADARRDALGRRHDLLGAG